jgi:hypothetical protein
VARQSLIPALLLAAGCEKPLPYEGLFQLPQSSAVLQPEIGGPFAEPIGFVANGHGGEIVQLALKQGRFLTDDETAGFLRTNPLATGGLRVLSSVAVVAPTVHEVTAWAGDQRWGTLLRVPYLYDCDRTPDRPECEGALPGDPVEQDAFYRLVSSPGTAEIHDITVKKGYTTTEEFTVTYDGTVWNVVGSRSGPQANAVTGLWYTSDLHRVSFTITDPGGKAQPGDAFVIRTENGLSENDVGGTPLAILTSPDQSLLALIVQDRTDGRPRLRWFDPEAREVVGDVTLAADSAPARMSWAEDGTLLVSDTAHPAVWEVAPGDAVALEHPMPWPTLDVTALDGDDLVRRLYVVPVDGHSLWVYDRDTDEPFDVNATLPGDQGMEFTANVTGIEALRRPYWMPEYSDDGIRLTGRAVAVALSSSKIVFAHEETGCLVQDALGPRTDQSSQSYLGLSDVSTTYLTTYPTAAQLDIQGSSGRHVVVDACAGIAPSQSWTVTYDQNVQAWRVHGGLSGEQANLAYEDVRYVSDDGGISFLIRSGAVPSRDGWRIDFVVNDGVAEANGDSNGDGLPEISIGEGADPVYFDYRVGLRGPEDDHQGEGWYPVDIRPFVLVPGASTDTVGRIDPQDAEIEVGWL